MNRRKMAAVALTASLAGGGTAAALAGLPAAIAQSAAESTSERGGWVDDALAPLVETGTITQAQADAVRQALLDARPVHKGGPGPVRLQAVADAVGIDVEDLRDALRDGQTIAQVAEANGVAVERVVDALVAELEAHLGEHVAEGELTQARADEILAGAPDRIEALVNGEAPLGGRGPGFHGPRGFGGPGGAGALRS